MDDKKQITYSYSRLDTYNSCPFKYWLKYIEGNYSKTSSIALEFGTLIHGIEEEIGNCIKDHKAIPYNELITKVLTEGSKLATKYPNEFVDKDKSNRTYADKIDFYINTGIYRLERFLKLNPELEILGCEVAFNFEYKGNKFKGSIDRVLHDTVTDQYIVQDIKTYAVPLKDNGSSDRDEHLVTPLQFVTYCTAMQYLYGVDPNTILCGYDLPLANTIQEAGTAGFIKRGYSKLDKLFAKIAEGDWTPKPTALCGWCDYCKNSKTATDETKYLCPYFSMYTKEHPIHCKENEWFGMENHQKVLEAYHKKYGITKKIIV